MKRHEITITYTRSPFIPVNYSIIIVLYSLHSKGLYDILLASSPGSLFLCERGGEKESPVSTVCACSKITVYFPYNTSFIPIQNKRRNVTVIAVRVYGSSCASTQLGPLVSYFVCRCVVEGQGNFNRGLFIPIGLTCTLV